MSAKQIAKGRLMALAFALASLWGVVQPRDAWAWTCCTDCDIKWQGTKCHNGTEVEYCQYCQGNNGYVAHNPDVNFGACPENRYDPPPGSPNCSDPGDDPCTNGKAEERCELECLIQCIEQGSPTVEDCSVRNCRSSSPDNWEADCVPQCRS